MEHLRQQLKRENEGIRVDSREGFSLLEMIGVIAIMGILVSVIAPNVLKSIDRAATNAEKQNLQAIGDALRNYLIENRVLPSLSTWADSISEYSDINSEALEKNPRGQMRTLVFDPASSPSKRAILISSMRVGLEVPTTSQLNSAQRFEILWDSPNGAVPSTSSWSGWSKWNAVEYSQESLVIERINLTPIYLDELRTCSAALNNTSKGPVSYKVVDKNDAQLASGQLLAGASTILSSLAKSDRIYMYSGSNHDFLLYTHIADGEDRSFDFSSWIPSAP